MEWKSNNVDLVIPGDIDLHLGLLNSWLSTRGILRSILPTHVRKGFCIFGLEGFSLVRGVFLTYSQRTCKGLNHENL